MPTVRTEPRRQSYRFLNRVLPRIAMQEKAESCMLFSRVWYREFSLIGSSFFTFGYLHDQLLTKIFKFQAKLQISSKITAIWQDLFFFMAATARTRRLQPRRLVIDSVFSESENYWFCRHRLCAIHDVRFTIFKKWDISQPMLSAALRCRLDFNFFMGGH